MQGGGGATSVSSTAMVLFDATALLQALMN